MNLILETYKEIIKTLNSIKIFYQQFDDLKTEWFFDYYFIYNFNDEYKGNINLSLSSITEFCGEKFYLNNWKNAKKIFLDDIINNKYNIEILDKNLKLIYKNKINHNQDNDIEYNYLIYYSDFYKKYIIKSYNNEYDFYDNNKYNCINFESFINSK